MNTMTTEQIAHVAVTFLKDCPIAGDVTDMREVAWTNGDGRPRALKYRPSRGVLQCLCGMPLADGRWIRDGAVHEDAVHKVIVDHISACTWEAPSNADLGSAS